MDFIVSRENSTAIVKTNVDKLNASNTSGLKAELLLLSKNSVNNIVIDMTKTKYCDSSGLSAILVANRMCRDTNGKFVLCGLQSNVMKMIEIAQLDRVLTIVSTEIEAISSID
ncbi:MAG: STAS domain-containing protein [Flavobacteriales bacterium]|tara:strand:- start:208 stop:546 length:339 start_codon:yes stop_codon:yes gene_type:complete